VGGVIAEELAEGLFVIGDVVFVDQLEEVARGVERQRGFREVWIVGEKTIRFAMDIGEIAAASARDEDLTAGQAAVVEQRNAAAVLACDSSAHEACGSGSQNDRVKFSYWIIHAFEARLEAGIEPQ